MGYIAHLGIIIGIFTVMNQGLILLMGFAGVVSVMQASLYGIGAYISALAALRFGAPFPLAVALAALGTAIVGLAIGKITSRVSGDYLALVTFGIGLILVDVFQNSLSVTQGPMGLPGIPRPFSSRAPWLLFVAFLVLLSIVLTSLIARSPFGRVLTATKDDAELATVLGRDTKSIRAIAFMLGAIFAGVAGSAYAHYVTFIDPSSFTITESVTILAMVVVGGSTRIAGGMLGACLLVLIPESLRFVGLPLSVAASFRQALFGLFLVVCMMYRPQGLLGRARL